MVTINDIKEANKTTLYVHGVQSKNQSLMERSIKKGVKNILSALNSGIVPGNGLLYLLIAEEIRKQSPSKKGKEAIAMQALADVMESLYKTLAENAGKNGLDAYVESRNKLAENKKLHLDYVQPKEIVYDQMQRSLETATALLRIDEVLSAKPLSQTSGGSSKVKIYTSDGCPWCSRTKEYLRSKGVSFREINVSQNPGAVQEMMNVSGQTGTPVTVVNGESVVGFDEAKLSSLLT